MKTNKFIKPQIIISRCLEFAACRYDGQVISDSFIRTLKHHVKMTTLCPEVDIGMGIPREPIRIVRRNDEDILIQPATGKEFTGKMIRYSRKTLNGLNEIDGFILKSRSPSCGIKDVKHFPDKPNTPSLGKTSGIFAREVLEKYGHLAIEDEGRLTNLRVREHFLTKLYTLSAFRAVKKRNSTRALTEFHAANKYLFMAYNQTVMRQIGRTAANLEKHPFDKVLSDYESGLHQLMSRLPRYTFHINALEHIAGYFKKELTSTEKRFFSGALSQYRKGKIPLSALLILTRGWVERYQNEYLMTQSYFLPFPEPLMSLADSGK